MAGESSVGKTELRSFASNFATGVAVVTTRTSDGSNFGLTMNAVTSLSLDPPLFLVCMDNQSTTLSALRQSNAFCIHYLSAGQKDISGVFASKASDKFASVPFSIGSLGCPIIDDVVAASECEVVDTFPGGDHTIVVGKVQSITINGGEPLVYHRGQYYDLCDMRVSA